MSQIHLECDTQIEGTTETVEPVTVVESKPPVAFPKIDRISVPSALGTPGNAPRLRYELRELLGEGGTGQVYAAFDHDLAREIAIKVVPVADARSQELFVQEAQVTASLGHPNVPPLYDAGATKSVRYLTMRRIAGQSLGALIRAAALDQSSQVLALGTLLEVMLKLCDAVAYAHAQGVIHRDIKPDNVMIGDFGEVMLVDWGAADPTLTASRGPTRIVGTLPYMAPEQLLGESPSPASDVYALGATLFHALLLRTPFSSSREELRRRKLMGEIDAPTAEELLRVPRPALGIAIKAMSLDPHERYPSVSALSQALRDFQAGRGAWAAPLVSETFHDDGYLERWVSAGPDQFVREPGCLVSRSELGALLIYKQRLATGLAIEFDGEIRENSRPGDLSVVWAEDDLLEGGPHWPQRGTTWSLQIGAFSNLSAGIYRDLWQCIAGRSLSIRVGQKYRIRAEINEQTLRLLLDGELVAEYEDLFPLSSGYLALYAYYPGKAFSNVKIYERGVPDRLSPTAVGDAFFACKNFEHAAKQYARIEQLVPLSAVAEEARYKRGLSLLQAGDSAGGQQAWSALSDELWRARAALHLVDANFSAGRHGQVVGELRSLLARVPALRSAIIGRWAEYVMRLCSTDAFALEDYVAFREAHFPEHLESAAAAAAAEVSRGNWKKVVGKYADQHVQVADAHNLLGDFEFVADQYSNAPWLRAVALLRLNRFDHPDVPAGLQGLVLLLRGDVEGALARDSIEAQLVAGEYERALDHRHIQAEDRAAALRGLGRIQEAAHQGDGRALALLDVDERVLEGGHRLEERLYLLHHLAFRALFAGDPAGFRRYRDLAIELPCAATWGDVWVHRYFLLPLVDQQAGDDGALERSLQHCLAGGARHAYGKLEYLARFVLGEISEVEFSSQPCRFHMAGRLAFASALRAEFVGDPERARHHYTSFLQLPPLERASDSARGDPISVRWAEVHSR